MYALKFRSASWCACVCSCGNGLQTVCGGRLSELLAVWVPEIPFCCLFTCRTVSELHPPRDLAAAASSVVPEPRAKC